MEDVRRCPRALESLLAARCSPPQLGSPARAPLSIAVAANDQESVEELLVYRNPNVASEGEEPPLCSAVCHRRRDIVRTLLLYRVDANVHSLPPTPPLAEGQSALGLTPLELAAADDRLVEMLTEYCGTQGEVLPSVMKGSYAHLYRLERHVSTCSMETVLSACLHYFNPG